MDTIIKKDGEPMPTLAFALDIVAKKQNSYVQEDKSDIDQNVANSVDTEDMGLLN
ncbi:MAG: hypothetical protein PHQ11_15035 [Paludibacter sp.]|nr:hypothetical protein [Paludibacter sp.]MDD4429636.1 hypothetical protein [Paludibacter sp.]